MEVLAIAIVSIACLASNILCLLIGVKVGQKVSKGEEVELPTVNPLKAVKEHKARQEAEWEQDRVNTILRNIESYDGTGYGQEDVPRG